MLMSEHKLSVTQITKKMKSVELYTHIYKLDNEQVLYLSGSSRHKNTRFIGTFAKDTMPYMCLRMVRVDGEDYGRGYVEEFLGDLKSLEGLSQSLVESAAASSKVVFMIRPNSVTKKRDLALTRNGDIITGSRDDVSVLQTDKQYDLRVVQESIRALEERMSFAFLLHTAIQRDAERVTAQEIRYMAEQLETSMGGIYSSVVFRVPIAISKNIDEEDVSNKRDTCFTKGVCQANDYHRHRSFRSWQ